MVQRCEGILQGAKEICPFLGISPTTLTKMMRAYQMPITCEHNRLWADKDSLASWARAYARGEAQRRPVADDVNNTGAMICR